MTKFERLVLLLLYAILLRVWQLVNASQVAVSSNDEELFKMVDEALKG